MLALGSFFFYLRAEQTPSPWRTNEAAPQKLLWHNICSAAKNKAEQHLFGVTFFTVATFPFPGAELCGIQEVFSLSPFVPVCACVCVITIWLVSVCLSYTN